MNALWQVVSVALGLLWPEDKQNHKVEATSTQFDSSLLSALTLCNRELYSLCKAYFQMPSIITHSTFTSP